MYFIYGKRTREVNGFGPDKTFAALDSRGFRVKSLQDACPYATREDAQEVIDKTKIYANQNGILFEIRKAK